MMPCPSNDGVHYEKGPPAAEFMKIDFAVAEVRIAAAFKAAAELARMTPDELDERIQHFLNTYPRVQAFREAAVAKAEALAARCGKRALVLRTTRVVTC